MMQPCLLLSLLAFISLRMASDGGFLSARKKALEEKVIELQDNISDGQADMTKRFGKQPSDRRFGGRLQHMSPLAYAARPCQTSVDFLQILDSEMNQSPVHWQYSQRMAQLLVDNFTLATDGTHMGLLNFGGETVQVLELTDPAGQNNKKAKQTIMQLKQLPGESYLDDAVTAAAQLLAGGRQVPHVLAVVSDFATPVNLDALADTMDQLNTNPAFVSYAVVMGDAVLQNATGADAVRIITGCENLSDGTCANLIRVDFTYPSIMMAAAEIRAFVCPALAAALEVIEAAG